MSRPPEPRSGSTRPIPPIEIGSFVALGPDDSEFIGSGSGVFFANTVFRAFAREAPITGTDAERSSGTEASTVVADPGSAHTYLVAPESEGEQEASGGTQQDCIAASSGTRSYGVAAPGLGVAPPASTARTLLMLYFRHWHPFFPFLHGPTFVDSVDRFYDDEYAATEEPAPPLHPKRLARAITFQCIFNIAALASGHSLDPAHRIQSSSALTSIIGIIFANHDIASLQALLAAELYLTTTMSLRAASTIHGALIRTMYNSGFHRCPCRYIQLRLDMAGIRKRIFWCAYVLDRHLSQALGHPPSIEDVHIDVCIPGMVELHTGAKNREPTAAQSTLNEEVLDHLPRSRASAERGSGSTPNQDSLRDAGSSSFSACSPAKHHTTVGKDANEFVLSYMATYSRLMGEIVNSFHNSIHARALNHEKIQELMHRVHCWWNCMPSTFQDESHDISSNSPVRSPYVAFFTMLYNYLVLIINRPFLSLPTERREFQSSLQTAVGASRSIILKVRRCTDDPFLIAWPGTLSAVWTAGLVVALASLLELYPLAKGSSDIEHCMKILNVLAQRWGSARHCHTALKKLLGRLNDHFNREPGSPSESGVLGKRTETRLSNANSGISDGQREKRPRLQADIGRQQPAQDLGTAVGGGEPGMNAFAMGDCVPVMEYTGPDFGFDASRLGEGLFTDPLDPDMGGLFSGAEWDTYL